MMKDELVMKIAKGVFIGIVVLPIAVGTAINGTVKLVKFFGNKINEIDNENRNKLEEEVKKGNLIYESGHYWRVYKNNVKLRVD